MEDKFKVGCTYKFTSTSGKEVVFTIKSIEQVSITGIKFILTDVVDFSDTTTQYFWKSSIVYYKSIPYKKGYKNL